MTRTSLKAVFLALIAFVFTAWSQFDTGTILGTVTDATGAAFPHAKVTARETGTNEERTFVTDQSGDYRFNALPRGTYRITVSAPGFESAETDRVTLDVTSQVRIDFKMQVGQTSQTVEVAASGQQLQTNTATMGTVIP